MRRIRTVGRAGNVGTGRRGASPTAALSSKAEFTARPRCVAVAGLLWAGLAGSLYAGPEGAYVLRGDVSIQRRGSETIIHASRNSIINYRSFDVAGGETVRFVQPDARSRVLNRIDSAAPTRIDGNLFANGIVYFVNPAGVYFGAGSVINVAGLYAAAGTMTDKAFLSNVDRFTNVRGEVMNEGAITGDFAALVGRSVVNAGQIVAPQGTVVLAAGQDVLVQERGSAVTLRIAGAAGDGAGPGVHNTGSIDARGGRAVMGAGDALGAAIVAAGSVRARDVRVEGQARGIVAVEGSIDAGNASGRGGTVRVLGEKVALRDAHIDASGRDQGGRVLVGGNVRGQGPERVADRTFVSAGTTIDAGATDRGHGGTVVVFADQNASFAGTITARGGATGGDGGFVEVSGRDNLAFVGKVDVRATHDSGKDGTILLDPRDITIQAGAGADDGQVSSGVDESVLFGDGGAATDFVLGEAVLESLQGNVVLQAQRDLTVAGGTTLDFANQTAGEAVQFLAGRTMTIGGTITTGGGAIDLRAGDNTGGTGDASGALAINSALASNGGNISLRTGGNGGITLNGAVNAGAGNVTLNAVGGGATQGAGAITGAGLELLGTGAFTLTNAANDVNTLAGSVGGVVAFTDADEMTIGTVNTIGLSSGGSTITLATGGGLGIAQSLNAGAGLVTINSASGAFTSGAGGVVASSLQLLGTGAFALQSATNNVATLAANVNGVLAYTDADAFTVGSAGVTSGIATGGSNVELDAGGLLTLAQGIVATGALVDLNAAGVTQGGGAIASQNLLLAGTGAFTLGGANSVSRLAANVSGALTFSNAGALEVGSLAVPGITSGNGNVTLTAGGTISLVESINAGSGIVRLSATSGGVNQTGGSIVASGLQLSGAGGFFLQRSTNDVDTLAAGVAGVLAYADADGVTIGTIDSAGINTGGSNVEIDAGGQVAITRAITATGAIIDISTTAGGAAISGTGAVVADALRATGTGNFSFGSPTNDLNQVAANVSGNFTIFDPNTLAVATIVDSGITAGGTGTLITARTGLTVDAPITNASGVLITTDAIAVNAAINGGQAIGILPDTSGLSIGLGGGAGALNLDNAELVLLSVAPDSLAGVTIGNLNAGAITTGALGLSGTNYNLLLRGLSLATGGIALNPAKNLTISVLSGATQTGAISAAGLRLQGTGPFTLTHAGNAVADLAGTVTGAVAFSNNRALNLGSVLGTNGLVVTGGDIALATTAGAITLQQDLRATGQTITLSGASGVGQVGGSVASANLLLLGNGPVTLTSASNDVGTLAANVSGAISYRDANALTVGSVASTSGVTSQGANIVLTTGGLLTLAADVTNPGARLALDSAGGVTQTAGAITTRGLELVGNGAFDITGPSNDAQFLAGNLTGQLTYRDADGLIIEAVGASATLAASGVDVRTNDGIIVNTLVASPGAVALHAGADGTGDLTFGTGVGPGVGLSAQAISLRAGDGAGSTALVDARTNRPTITGTGGASSNPTSFAIRQDADIGSALLPEASQWGAGGPTGVAYALDSDRGGVGISGGAALAGANLTIDALNGTSITDFLPVGSLVVNGPLSLGAGIGSSGDVTLNGPVVLNSSAEIAAANGAVTLQNGANAGAHDLTLDGVEVDWLGALTGTGRLTVMQRPQVGTVVLGGAGQSAGQLDVTAGELANIADGWRAVRLGRAGSGSTVRTAGAIDFRDAVLIQGGGAGGVVDVDHDLRGVTPDASISIDANGGTINLRRSIETAGNLITLNGGTVLHADATLDTTGAGSVASGGNITLLGTVDADDEANARTLTLLGGTSGIVDARAGMGTTERLAALDATGASILVSDVRTTGAQTYGADTTTLLGGTLSSSVAGAITFTRDVRIANDATIATAGQTRDDDITIFGRADSINTALERSLTLNAGQGDVAIGGDVGATALLSGFAATGFGIDVRAVRTSGDVVFNGPTTLSGDVRGSRVIFNDRLDLNADLSIAGTNAVDFNTIVRSTPGAARRLTVSSASTVFAGAVGEQPGEQLRSLSTSGGRVATFGGTIHTIETTSLGGPVELRNDLTVISDTQRVEFLGTINSDSTARALTVFAPGEVFMGGNVGGTNQLLTLDVAAPLRVGDIAINTVRAQGYSGPVTLDGSASFIGDTIAFTSGVNSGANGAKAFTVNAGPGLASFTQALGATSSLASATISGGAITLAQGVRTTGSQAFNGPTRLGGNLVSTQAGTISLGGPVRLENSTTITTAGAVGDSVTFSGTVDAVGTGRTLNVNAGSGAVAFTNAVGTSTLAGDLPLAALTVSGGSIDLREVRTTGSQAYSGPTTLRANLTSTTLGDIALVGATILGASTTIQTNDGFIAFNGSVDSDSTTRDLVVNTGGNKQTLFFGDVGSNSRLNTLTVNADGTTTIGGSTVRTTGRQSWGDAITVTAQTLTFEGPDVQFTSTLDSDSTPRAVVINTRGGGSTGVVTFGGNVGATNRLASLRTQGTGPVRVGANISTTGGVDVEGAVRLLGVSTIDGGSGSMLFRSTIDTESSFAPAPLTILTTAAPSLDAAPFRFGGRIGGTTALGSLVIGADRAATPNAATIVFSDGFDANGRIQTSAFSAQDLFGVTTTGDFTVGRNQKILSFGRLRISAGGTARIGDIVSLADINITAAAIRLLARAGGTVITDPATGATRTDPGMDIVSAGDVVMSTAPIQDGAGTVAFATNTGLARPETSAFTFRQFTGGVRPALLADTRTGGGGFFVPLDLVAEGPSSAVLSTSLAGALPRDVGGESVGAPPEISSDARSGLEEMGIRTRDLTAEEAIEFLVGRRLFKDAPTLADPGTGDYRVTAGRLNSGAVDRAISSYRALVLAPAKDPQGRAIMDEAGKPRLIDQTPRLREALSQAWEGYAKRVEKPTGGGLRAFLENRGAGASAVEREALSVLNRSRDVLTSIDAMGLSAFEASIPRRKLLGAIKPATMTERDAEEAVVGLRALLQ